MTRRTLETLRPRHYARSGSNTGGFVVIFTQCGRVIESDRGAKWASTWGEVTCRSCLRASTWSGEVVARG